MADTVQIILEGDVYTEQRSGYVFLPFEVPPHIGRIDVRLEYSDQTGSEPDQTEGNCLDMDIYDPRRAEGQGHGFRGGCGSSRKEFFIALHDATPGYIAGPIQSGAWQVSLGLFKIWQHGCHYKITVSLMADETNDTTAAFLPLLPLSKEPARHQPSAHGWYKGDLHCHTYHSDGDSDPVDLVRVAESLGLDFLAITDHNTVTHQAVLNTVDTPLMLIPGIEVTTFRGHWNVWGDFGWVDFHLETARQMDEAIRGASQRGYLTSCNHPRPEGPAWEFESVESFYCIEVWNGPWWFLNSCCLSFWEAHLNQGKRYVAVGGSDTHTVKHEDPGKLGVPTTYIFVDGQPSPARLLDGIRAGHVFVTESPSGPQLILTSAQHMMGDSLPRPRSGVLSVSVHVVDGGGLQLQLVGNTGVLCRQDINSPDVNVALDVEVHATPYVYARLVTRDPGDGYVHCLTNPLYLEAR